MGDVGSDGMNFEIRARLVSLGTELGPEMMQGTRSLFAESFGGMHPDTQITRDCTYGPDERHRLDVFTCAARRNAPAPVLVFVHGGGFVMGDKRTPDTPFYDNVGDFAVRAGLVGVTMTYRLAPANPWPAGTEDVAQALKWLRANVAEYGGDPERIFLMGQSAGAVHVAGYVAHANFQREEWSSVAGALLISGIYDVAAAEANPFHIAYYGEDRSAWPACSTLEGLVHTALPLFFSVSEFDAADFQKQAAQLVGEYAWARGEFPRMHWLAGHNHLSPVLAIGSPGETLGPRVLDFVQAASALRARP